MIFIIFLLLLGLVFIGIEIFIPGGIMGLMGGVAVAAAVGAAFVYLGFAGGMLFLVGAIVGVFLTIYLCITYVPRSRLGKAIRLNKQIPGGTRDELNLEYQAYVGKTGTAESTLRPTGIAMVEGHRLDVIAEEGFIDKGTIIRVERIEDMKVFVRRVEDMGGNTA